MTDNKRWEDEEKANYTVEALTTEFRERLYGSCVSDNKALAESLSIPVEKLDAFAEGWAALLRQDRQFMVHFNRAVAEYKAEKANKEPK
jgi:hypothetical protein